MTKKMICALMLGSYVTQVVPVYAGGPAFGRQERRQSQRVRQKQPWTKQEQLQNRQVMGQRAAFQGQRGQESKKRVQGMPASFNASRALPFMAFLSVLRQSETAPTSATPQSFDPESPKPSRSCEYPFLISTDFSVMNPFPELHLLSSGKIMGDFGQTHLSEKEFFNSGTGFQLIRAVHPKGQCVGVSWNGIVKFKSFPSDQNPLPYARESLVREAIENYLVREAIENYTKKLQRGDNFLPQNGKYGFIRLLPADIEAKNQSGIYQTVMGETNLTYSQYKDAMESMKGPAFVGIEDHARTRFYLRMGLGEYVQFSVLTGKHLGTLIQQTDHVMHSLSEFFPNFQEDPDLVKGLFANLILPTTTPAPTTSTFSQTTLFLHPSPNLRMVESTTLSPDLQVQGQGQGSLSSAFAMTGLGVSGLVMGGALTGLGFWVWQKWKRPKPIRRTGAGSSSEMQHVMLKFPHRQTSPSSGSGRASSELPTYHQPNNASRASSVISRCTSLGSGRAESGSGNRTENPYSTTPLPQEKIT